MPEQHNAISGSPFSVNHERHPRKQEPPQQRDGEADAREIEEAAAGAFAGGVGGGHALCHIVPRAGWEDRSLWAQAVWRLAD